MKYLITESQYKLISEIERTWRDSEYAEQYERHKTKFINFFITQVKSYDENDSRIYFFDSEHKAILVYNKINNDLYYDSAYDRIYGDAFPHPIWLVHGKFIMADLFKTYFPDYEVKSVKSIMLNA